MARLVAGLERTGLSVNGWYRDYLIYLASPEWQRKREEKFAEVGRACEYCGCTEHLQVHHKTYERMKDEPLSDLQVLCPTCHYEADIERAVENAERGEKKRFRAWLRAREEAGFDDRYRSEHALWCEFDEWRDD